MNDKIIDAIKGGIWGLIVGDALGVPVEFQDREELEKNPVIDMRAYGTHNQPKGTWSDDTSMTLCLVDNLINGYDLNEIANNFVKWYRHGFMTPYGVAFDVGNTTRKAIYNIEAGVKVTEAGGASKYDNGNGSSGYVVHTIEASLWCFFNNDNYKDTVLQAVNLGSDTDTTAAVVGGLAGIYYGFNDICESWINDIVKGEMIKKLICEFCNSIIFLL